MDEQAKTVNGVRVPRLLYGTAWKEDDTQRLVELAIKTGFRGIDTANQRRHYDEAAVGQAISTSIAGGIVRRDDLFIQTKFTFRPGQDHRLPYDPSAPIADQVSQSFASSLEHLGIDMIDSYLLHGPSTRAGLAADDWAAWRAMESIHESGRARLLGISNVNLGQLSELCREALIRPRFVQNRCYASQGWDRAVREFCALNGIVYQGFSLLTANRDVLTHPLLVQTAKQHGLTPSQSIFRFALDVGILPLTGTSSTVHMREDLDILDSQLSDDEVRAVERVGIK